MGVENLDQQQRIRRAKQDRLNMLEEQAATYGIDTPPHITIEIGTLRKELEIRETVITSPIAPKLAQELGPNGQFIFTAALVEQLGKRVDSGFQQLGEWIERVEARATSDTKDVDARREEGQRSNRNLILVVGGALALFMLVVAVILGMLVQDLAAIRSVGR